MKCPKCSEEVAEKTKYCPYCGFNLKVNVGFLKVKIDEFRHKIYEGYIMMGLGFAIAFFGGWLGLSFWETRYEWQGWGLYKITYSLFREPATMFLLAGLIFIIAGAICGGYYDHKKGKLLKQLEGID